jgi:hypothetical protein
MSNRAGIGRGGMQARAIRDNQPMDPLDRFGSHSCEEMKSIKSSSMRGKLRERYEDSRLKPSQHPSRRDICMQTGGPDPRVLALFLWGSTRAYLGT